MSIVKTITLLLLSSLLMLSCEKVEKLSDNVKLSGFKVLSHSPTTVELGEPYIDTDTIFIPVLRGISLFPLSINAEPIADGNTKQILTGTSFSSFSDIVFQPGGIDDKIFFLIAKSGLAKPYYIKLDISEQNSESAFMQFDIVSSSVSDVLLPSKAYIDPINKHIAIHGINLQLPITIDALISLSENAEIVNTKLISRSNAPLSLSFASLTDTIQYSVEAESGKVETWKAYVNPATPVTGSESGDILTAVSIRQNRLEVESETPGYSILATKISFDLGEINFGIIPGVDFSELVLKPEINLFTNSFILGFENGAPVTFTDYNDSQDFYMLDNRTGYYKSWAYKIAASGVTDITKFEFTYDDTPSGSGQILLLEGADIDNIYKKITLYVTEITPGHFPLTVTPTLVEASNGAKTNIGTMSFSGMDDIYSFKVFAESKEEDWSVVLESSSAEGVMADIESLTIESSSLSSLRNSDINIYSDRAEITIDIVNASTAEIFNPQLQIKPIITLSEGAEFVDYNGGEILEFGSFSETATITIEAGNGSTRQWKIRLINKPQLPNSGFELWKTDGLYPTISETPGVGLGWATANNSFVKGTLSTSNPPNGNAAEMTTDIVDNFLIKNLITSGTLYVGQFKLSLDMDNPRSMTKFGIPFEASPTAVKIDAKYRPGNSLQRSVNVSGMKYRLENVAGEDKGQIWIELVNWSGSGNIDYSGEANANIKVLARGEYNFIGASGWNRITIPFIKNSSYDLYPVTHIVIVIASSAEGHLFLGAKESVLTVDNIELVY